MKNVPKSSKIFHCKKCDYITSRKSQWKRHLETKKHILNTLNKIRTQKVPKCACGKTYKSRSGLYYHQKKCAYTVEKLEEKEIIVKGDSMEEKLLKEIRDLKEEMKNIKINQTINNQKININVFLNEHCKNAMSLEDFVNKLQLTLHDVAKTTELGFAGGLSNILIKNLNDIPTINRPIHCSDTKRLKFYVKDNEGWNIDASNQKVDKAIEIVTTKQIKKIKDWEATNPNYLKDDEKLKQWQIMIHSLTGPSNDNDREKDHKSIKRKMGENIILKDAMLELDQ